MTADLDLEFQNAIADDLPAVLVNPTGGLEESDAVVRRARPVRGGARRRQRGRGRGGRGRGLGCPTRRRRPTSPTRSEWFNTDGKPLTIAELTGEGQVVLIDFWTYTCINCIRTLPYLEAWDAEYRDDGLTIVGVHAPEFPFERDAGNVADAIDRQRDPTTRSSRTTSSAPGRLRQPVLAGQVPDRRRGPGPLRPLRRGRLRGDRGGDPQRCCAEAGDGDARRRRPGQRRDAPTRGCARPRPTSAPRAPQGWVERPVSPGSQRLRAPDARLARPQPVRLRRRLGRSATSGDRRATAPASRCASRRRASSWCWARPRTAATCEVLLDGKPIPDAWRRRGRQRRRRDDRPPAPLPAGRPARGRATTR